MPEKLLSCKDRGDVFFGWQAGKPFDLHPKLALKIAKIVAEWSVLENALSRIFISMLGSDPVPGAAMYSSLTAAASQKAALRAVADTALTTEQRDIFEVLLGFYNTAQKDRNKIVHWVWGYGTELKDALVLADPACFTSHKAQSIRFENEGRPVSPDFDFDKVYIYRARDFDQLSEKVEKLMGYLSQFLIVISPKKEDLRYPERTSQRLRQLQNVPEIRQALLRQLERRRTNP